MDELNIKDLEHIPIPDGLEARLSAKIDEWAQEEIARKSHKHAYMRIAVSLAASVLIVAGIAFMFYSPRQGQKDTYDDPHMAYITAEQALILLSDNLERGMNEYTEIRAKGQRANEILTKQLNKYK